ncbi:MULTISPECIES: inner membrane protein YhjD [Pseudonocardia]|uniref:Inner membrane protein YhjD n=2 Tax=Pseudonocardia TaxID=1847 RepID=A0A1Y2MGJ4_PSEAH|nr:MULTISPECIES: inner membrane protein YhjD [Pseudonocardia]OSY34406.1 Inner membrane protein YhjD [Pseudonocardia autotrophica]TDN73766.1 membrane protein [Pseudonocardia autotrophica]BBG04512.1 inner membrane protein YhjD [Pseudonocardia autotrophica]GEC29779.1 inner membrane protein YhjD [Pseudonocardia saturnea]
MADNRPTTTAHRFDEDEEEGPTFLERQREKHPWLDHLVRAGERYTENHGDHYAAAITYFSILALVPLLMVAFAAAGFVLRGNPELLEELRDGIASAAPGGLGETLGQVVDTAVDRAGAIGLIGLGGALYSGIGWMSNLREALTEQWGQRDEAPPMIKRLAFDLLALVGLGLAMVLSFAIASVTGSLGVTLLGMVGLGGVGWAIVLLNIVGFLVGLLGNWLVFLWVIARLPREPVTFRSAAKAALLGAIGFVILQRVMVLYLGSFGGTPVGQAFGPILGLLIFIFFTSRFLLFVTAWAASAEENDHGPRDIPGPAVIRPQYVVREGPGALASAGLVTAGVIGGALGLRALGRRRR